MFDAAWQQDFIQVLSMFSGFGFRWPPEVLDLFSAFSIINFNLELLAPECSVNIAFENKWYVVQSLPLLLLAGIAVVMTVTRTIQWVQQHVFRVLPFGALSQHSLLDSCIGILISGVFMLYFGM